MLFKVCIFSWFTFPSISRFSVLSYASSTCYSDISLLLSFNLLGCVLNKRFNGLMEEGVHKLLLTSVPKRRLVRNIKDFKK